MSAINRVVVGGIEVPPHLVNNNCVQDAAHRLGYAIRMGFTDEYVAMRRQNLRTWIAVAERAAEVETRWRAEALEVQS